jgi:hypothetical protein
MVCVIGKYITTKGSTGKSKQYHAYGISYRDWGRGQELREYS